jgi:hypothetical protein
MTLAFEDDLTRELPSALRTFTDLVPISVDLAEDILELEEHELLPIAEHTVRIPRPASMPAFSLDVASPRPHDPWSQPLVLLIGGALLVACALAGIVGIVAGRTFSPGDALVARQPRISVALAATELVTVPAPSAPGKSIAPVPRPAPRPVLRAAVVRPPPPAPPPPTPSGRGHMGSDRH